MNENNTKKFIEERKRQAMIQSRQLESLKKLHEKQHQDLVTTMQQVVNYVVDKMSTLVIDSKYGSLAHE